MPRTAQQIREMGAKEITRSLPLGPMLNESGLLPQHVELDRSAPSFVTLPTVRGRTWEN